MTPFRCFFFLSYVHEVKVQYVQHKEGDTLLENQYDLELDSKVFSLLILVVEASYLMNPTDATLASLNVLKY